MVGACGGIVHREREPFTIQFAFNQHFDAVHRWTIPVLTVVGAHALEVRKECIGSSIFPLDFYSANAVRSAAS